MVEVNWPCHFEKMFIYITFQIFPVETIETFFFLLSAKLKTATFSSEINRMLYASQIQLMDIVVGSKFGESRGLGGKQVNIRR